MADQALAERGRPEADYRVQIAYRAPVEVIVDVRRGTVDRVVVINEGVALDPEEGARQESVLLPIPSPIAKRAIEIADAGDWPVWEHSF